MTQETAADGRSRMRRAVAEPHSRRKFVLLAGGTSAAGVALAACGDDSDSSTTSSSTMGSTEGEDVLAEMFGEGDLGIVNYALTLEYLEAAFYEEVASSGLFKGEDLALIKEFGKNENEHVAALDVHGQEAWRQARPRSPKTKFDLDRRRHGAADRGRSREPRRRRLPGPGGERSRARAILAGRTVDPHGRGPPRRGAQSRARPDHHPRRPVREPATAQTVLDPVQPFIVS